MTERSHRRLPRKLTGYALAAAASLVAEDALAEIKYTNLGPNGVEILNTFSIDLDGDSIVEFTLTKRTDGGRFGCTTYGCWDFQEQDLSATASPAHQLLATAGGFARALPAGFNIDASDQGLAKAALAFTYFATGPDATRITNHGGEFFNTRAYLGLIVDLSDGRHAGWAEIGAWGDFDGRLDAYIYGYAYEKTPGTPIAAGAVPEPPSLLLLAVGATGLAALRARRRVSGRDSTSTSV